MEEKILYIAILIIFELYEASWQKSNSLKGMIENIFTRYQKGQIIFFLSHPTYWFVLLVAIKYQINNFWMLAIIFLKTSDIVFKLWLIQTSINQKRLEILNMPDVKISPNLIYINTIVYTFLFIMALG